MRFLPLLFVWFGCACNSSNAGDVKKTKANNATEVHNVLLELFTSQGCSSCPPADKLVSRLAQADTNLLVISFHVDYWDRLGWKDVYSNHDYTARQQKYVSLLHAESVYTPQAVVQGQFEMVGSNRNEILNAIKKARDENIELKFSTKVTVNNQMAEVGYKLSDKVPADCKIVAVLVNKESSTLVMRGENSGKQLTSYHIARAIASASLTKQEGALQFGLPGDMKEKASAAIIFIQNISSGKVLAVNQNSL